MTDFTQFPIPTKMFDPAQFAGADGREVEFQKTDTHIQWRYVDGAWQDLVALSELMGSEGPAIELQVTSTHIQWRVVGDESWVDLIALDEIGGGANIPRYAIQKPNEPFPERPSGEVVYWHTWDEPEIDPAEHPYDVWFQIPKIVPPGVPSAFTAGQWAVDLTGESGELAVTISDLPAANPEITDIEHRIDAGAAVSFGAGTTGIYLIEGLTDDVEVSVQIRAINAEGTGAWSDTKLATPTEAPPSGTSAWWLHPVADPYGRDSMRESSDGTGDPVELNDSVGWAEDVS